MYMHYCFTKSLLRSTPCRCVFWSLNLRGAAPRFGLPLRPRCACCGCTLGALSISFVALRPSAVSSTLTALQIGGQIDHVGHTQTAPEVLKLGINRPDFFATNWVPEDVLDRAIPLAAQYKHLTIFHWLYVRQLFDRFARRRIRLF